VVVVASGVDMRVSNRLVRRLTDEGCHVEFSVTLRDVASNRLRVQELGRFPILYVEPVVRTGWRPVAKRAFDILCSSFLLLITAPLLAFAALSIKLDSRGPVLFKQTRVGRGGRHFTVYKLRTMVADAEALKAKLARFNESDGPLFKMKHDPRVTR